MTNGVCVPIPERSGFRPMPVVGKFLSSVSKVILLVLPPFHNIVCFDKLL
jgi:hypothetical protein